MTRNLGQMLIPDRPGLWDEEAIKAADAASRVFVKNERGVKVECKPMGQKMSRKHFPQPLPSRKAPKNERLEAVLEEVRDRKRRRIENLAARPSQDPVLGALPSPVEMTMPGLEQQESTEAFLS